MGDPDTMALFDSEELDAIQWDSLDEEMSRSLDFQIVPDYDELLEIYTASRR
jgi:spermidine/putrescine transport system substrate-binding protein